MDVALCVTSTPRRRPDLHRSRAVTLMPGPGTIPLILVRFLRHSDPTDMTSANRSRIAHEDDKEGCDARASVGVGDGGRARRV
eukprot:1742300-Rhodomonas_salina.1